MANENTVEEERELRAAAEAALDLVRIMAIIPWEDLVKNKEQDKTINAFLQCIEHLGPRLEKALHSVEVKNERSLH
jgi:hypothetical protein